MRWNHTVNHSERPLTLGFVSTVQQSAQPRIVVAESNRKIRNIDDISSIWKRESELSWLVPGLLADGSVNLLSGASDVGKTWFSLFLAGAVARGSSVFGQEVGPRRVVYLDGENPDYVIKQKLFDLGIAETANLKIWGGWENEPPPGPGDPVIVDWAQKERPLFIWDSLVEFSPGDEQSSRETRNFMRKFRRLAFLGATVIILHHTGKSDGSQEYRGSSDIKAVVDMAFLLERVGNRRELDEVVLEQFKSRLAVIPKRKLKFVRRVGFELLETIETTVSNAPDPIEVVKEIVAATPGLNQSEIVKRAMAAGISKHTVPEILKQKEFRLERGRGRSLRYHIALKPALQAESESEQEELAKGDPA